MLQAAFFVASLDAARGAIYKNRVKVNWSSDNSHIWYRNDLAKGEREYILVDVEKGVRKKAFDHGRLAKLLVEAGIKNASAENLALDQLLFDVGKNTVTFRAGGRYFHCDLGTYGLKVIEKPAVPATKSPPESPKTPEQKRQARYNPSRGNSPDGKWRAFVRDHNLFVASTEGDEEIQLSKDGADKNAYQTPYWAPNSNSLFAFRVQPGEPKEVYLVESSPKEGGRAKLRTRHYPLPGDKFTIHELNFFDVAKRTQHKPDGGRIDFRSPNLRWTPDGSRFRFEKTDRGHQRLRVVEVDTNTGETRNIIDEQTKTFIWTQHYQNNGVPIVSWLKKTNEIVHLSERDGWRHLYLIDVDSDDTKRKQITKGEFVVRFVDKIDEENRQIWFRATGRNAGQDPYLMHYYRVNFDGSGFTALTEGNGYHEIQYSPDRQFIIDKYDRIDMAPVHELRRVSDGSLVCQLETSDISELEATGWKPPEVFTAKGRDGKTDIWGIICRPRDLDPKKKYPVLEAMYAGPHSSYVPKRFNSGYQYSNWTDQGYVVVKVDGMGTANRSKAFHDVCWHNLKDAGFPDRILWHQAIAKKYKWYDISRVGIYGGSAGGQSSTGALLFHPNFYRVAVSSCGCHDNRMDKASWNEQWMGYPVGPHYAASSNIDNAHRLEGKLLLIVGELDNNVPPESTMRLCAALIKADKDFDMVVVPGAGHGGGGRHGDRKRVAFFKRHLLDVEPGYYDAKPDESSAVGR